MRLSNWQVNLLVFFLVAIIVWLLEFTILNLSLGIGFSPDDWELYLRFKSLGVAPLTKIGQVWAERGLYTTYQIYYMGLLDFLVGYNHRLFQTVNLIFKIIATLSLYPLVMVVFHRRSLAILTTFMFAISHASVGSMEYPVKGSDYVSIFFMSMFLMTYFLILKRRISFIYLGLAFILLIISISFSPIRMFPLLFALPLIEIFLLIKHRNLNYLKQSIIRMIIFYTPFIYLIFHLPGILIGSPPVGIYHRVIQGKWYLLLSPFSGLGYTFITGQYWGTFFGQINTDSFGSFVSFLIKNPLVIYGCLTALFASLHAKKKWRFFTIVFVINFVAEILAFFVAYNYRYLLIKNDINFDPNTLYSILFGLFILILSIALFIQWLVRKNKNSLLLSSWLGLALLIIFTVGTWAFAPDGTQFSATSYYLVVASIGTSLFLAASIVSIYEKTLYLNKVPRFAVLTFLSIFIISLVLMSTKQIYDRFKYLVTGGRGSSEQALMQKRVKGMLKNFNLSTPTLFYFDTSEASLDSFYLSETLLLTFPSWMHLENGKVRNGCIEVLPREKTGLAKYVQIKEDKKGFEYRSLCVDEGGKGFYYQTTFYNTENFYAFKLKGKDLFDIKQETLRDLGF